MLTAGVDLSAEEMNTCLAIVQWRRNTATVVELQTRVGNAAIVLAAGAAAKVGIDCPFGWPVPFLEFIAEHDAGQVGPRDGRPLDWRRRLAYRTTDLAVQESVPPLRPLSVSADRIAHAAMRCATLLAEISSAGIPVDRTGQTGAVVEVYPSASLFRWGLLHQGYKRRANAANLDGLVDALLTTAPWLDLGNTEHLCRRDDNAFDAVIASLSARAALLGLTQPPTREQHPMAAREGWIAIPHAASLARLIEPAPTQ